jgi:hypothetical protein
MLSSRRLRLSPPANPESVKTRTGEPRRHAIAATRIANECDIGMCLFGRAGLKRKPVRSQSKRTGGECGF